MGAGGSMRRETLLGEEEKKFREDVAKGKAMAEEEAVSGFLNFVDFRESEKC